MEKKGFLRIIALILCAAMMMCVFTACEDEIIYDADEEAKEAENENEDKNEFTILYEHFEEDEPVMKIGDVEITWGVLYFYFYQEVTQLYLSQSEIMDWTAIYQNGMTYLEYCVSEAVYNYLRQIAGVEHFAKELNVELTEEQKATIVEDREFDIEVFGTEELMTEYMDSRYLSEDVANYIAEIQYQYNNVMEAMVGLEGEKLTVEEITELADTAYKMLKAVAIPKSQSDAYAKAEAALAEVKATPASGLDAKFDELINTYCEAEKVEELTKGYVFTRGYFDDNAVELALKELDKGQYYDGVVEGEEYYYVIMRQPVDVEAYPYYGAETGYGDLTLRVLYSDDIFEKKFWAWADDTAEVEFYDNISNMIIEEVLGW